MVLMARWITFDQQTFSLLRAKLAQGTAIETFGRGALDYALAKPGTVVALLPSLGHAEVGMAVFRPPQTARPMVEPARERVVSRPLPAQARPLQAKATRAGGFLGLSDELYEEEPVEEKKGWWRRFWDE
jgi:hypothetical protein